MNKKTKWGLAAAVLLLLLGVFFWPRGNDEVEVAQSTEPVAKTDSVDDGSVVIGGVRRSAKDLRESKQPDSAANLVADDPSLNYGRTPAIAPDANPQVAAVVKAVREKNRPELLSPAIASRPFDADAYAKDPQAWLDSPEPGRVFQPAQPGPDVPEIRRLGDFFVPVVQGESVKLSVSAVPKSPVTFTSFDLGQFSNQLTTITVAADDRGVATAEFLATPGVIDKVNILSASPLSSGQVKFVVNVSLPENGG